MKKILIIAAHPDDEIYGMGGTIAKLAKEGNEIHLLIVTDGSTAQYRENPNLEAIIHKKRCEAQVAAGIVGITAIHHGNLPDMRLDQTDHIIINEVIEKCVAAIKPDTVYTHFWGDVNLDHQRVFQSTLVAVRPMPNQSVTEVFCYSVPSSTEWQAKTGERFAPNCFVDISKFYRNKVEAINAYGTELRDFPHPRSVEAVLAQDRAAGLRCGREMCEEFILLRKIV